MIGIILAALTRVLLENKRVPAALVVVLAGLTVGLLLGTREGPNNMRIGINSPTLLPKGIPSLADFASALVILVLPQLPMTLGNAVIASADLSREYFGEQGKTVTYSSLCMSMSIANFLSFFLGGMPCVMEQEDWPPAVVSVLAPQGPIS